MESYDKFNLTLPEPKQKELEELMRQYSTVVTYPAKTVFLEPGSVLDGVYYIASGRRSPMTDSASLRRIPRRTAS